MFPSAVVSGDGNVVAGRNSASQAYRWTEAQGFQTIHAAGMTDSAGLISENGSTIVGASSTVVGEFSFSSGWVWTTDDGARDLAGGFQWESPQILAPDESFIVGSQSTNEIDVNRFTLLKWDLNGNATVLFGPQVLSPLRFFQATGVDGTCRLIVGNNAEAGAYFGPLAWTSAGGFIPFGQFLQSSGIDFTGWTLTSVSKMSADGLTFAGSGINPDGLTETWIATIPAPGTLVFIAGAALAVGRRRR